jgi:hypothetical protein
MTHNSAIDSDTTTSPLRVRYGARRGRWTHMTRGVIIVFLGLLAVGCSGVQYKPLGEVDKSATIETPLYFASVPSVSVFGRWKRYSRPAAPDDLVITEGWQDESYAATVSVHRQSALMTVSDLQGQNVAGVLLSGAPVEKRQQPNLLCVRQPVVSGEVEPYPAGSYFVYAMGCVDTTTHIYYALAVSWKVVDDRGPRNNPSAGFKRATDDFFSGFRVK